MRSRAVSLFLEAVIQPGTKQPATARLLVRRGRRGIICGIIKAVFESVCLRCFD